MAGLAAPGVGRLTTGTTVGDLSIKKIAQAFVRLGIISRDEHGPEGWEQLEISLA